MSGSRVLFSVCKHVRTFVEGGGAQAMCRAAEEAKKSFNSAPNSAFSRNTATRLSFELSFLPLKETESCGHFLPASIQKPSCTEGRKRKKNEIKASRSGGHASPQLLMFSKDLCSTGRRDLGAELFHMKLFFSYFFFKYSIY